LPLPDVLPFLLFSCFVAALHLRHRLDSATFVRFVEFFGRYGNEKSKRNDPESDKGTYNRSGDRDSTAKKLVDGSASISGEFDRDTSHAYPSKQFDSPVAEKGYPADDGCQCEG
jgi:hypothetical protein